MQPGLPHVSHAAVRQQALQRVGAQSVRCVFGGCHAHSPGLQVKPKAPMTRCVGATAARPMRKTGRTQADAETDSRKPTTDPALPVVGPRGARVALALTLEV